MRQNKKIKKEIKIIKEIKPKIKIIKEINPKIKIIEENKREKKEEEKSKAVISEIDDLTSIKEFKAPSIVLERQIEAQPQGEIQQTSKDRQTFDKEEKTREAGYNVSRRQQNARENYSSRNYSPQVENSSNLFTNRSEIISQRPNREQVAKGAPIQQNTSNFEQKVEKYQDNQQQKKRRYPWEV